MTTPQPPYGSTWPAPASTPPKREAKRVHWGGAVLIGVLCFLLGVGCGSASANSRPSAAPAATPSAPAQAPPTYRPPVATVVPAPVAPAGAITNGTYEIGTEVAPGKYKTAGPADTRYWPMCYWARLKDTTGDIGSIIANDNIRGQTTITIKESDGAFETNGCQPWIKVG